MFGDIASDFWRILIFLVSAILVNRKKQLIMMSYPALVQA